MPNMAVMSRCVLLKSYHSTISEERIKDSRISGLCVCCVFEFCIVDAGKIGTFHHH